MDYRLIFLATAACTGDPKSDTGLSGSETGLDTDTPEDTGDALDATGEWVGDCAEGDDPNTVYGYHIALSLVDEDGALTGTLGADVFTGTGTGSSTTVPYLLYGTREGDHLQLAVDYSTGGTIPGSFDLVLDGDTLEGTLLMYPDLELFCVLAR